jgi:hypothetical protein
MITGRLAHKLQTSRAGVLVQNIFVRQRYTSADLYGDPPFDIGNLTRNFIATPAVARHVVASANLFALSKV